MEEKVASHGDLLSLIRSLKPLIRDVTILSNKNPRTISPGVVLHYFLVIVNIIKSSVLSCLKEQPNLSAKRSCIPCQKCNTSLKEAEGLPFG